MKIWILTYEVNDYDQHGEYFLAAFTDKPNKQKLSEILKTFSSWRFSEEQIKKVIETGGGRTEALEHCWPNLDEVFLN